MNVLVLGGRGHIGAIAHEHLCMVPEIESTVASHQRSGMPGGTVYCDVREAASWDVLRDFDAIINCTDTFSLPPDELYAHCLLNGLTLFESSAEADVYDRMARIVAAHAGAPGRLIPGFGVFPGLSNLLVAEAQRTLGDSLTLELSWSVLSGAGAGTCEVMVQALSRPRLFVHDSELRTGAPLGAVARTGFEGRPWGLELGLPEAVLLPRSLGLRRLTTVADVRPRSPGWVLRGLSTVSRWGLFRAPGARPLMRSWFRMMRGTVLRQRSTELSMRVTAESNDVGDHAASLHCDDAFRAAGIVAASCLSLLREQPLTGHGLQPLEKQLTLEQVMERMGDLGFEGIRRARQQMVS